MVFIFYSSINLNLRGDVFLKMFRSIIGIIGISLGILILNNIYLVDKYVAIPYIIMGIGAFNIFDGIYLYLKKKKT